MDLQIIYKSTSDIIIKNIVFINIYLILEQKILEIESKIQLGI